MHSFLCFPRSRLCLGTQKLSSSAQVRTVVAHEPPAVLLLPNAAKWLAFFDGVYTTYRKDGIPSLRWPS
jgi:hypothetical protein